MVCLYIDVNKLYSLLQGGDLEWWRREQALESGHFRSWVLHLLTLQLWPFLLKVSTPVSWSSKKKTNIYLIRGFFVFCFSFNFWLHWVFVAACGLSLVAANGVYSLLRWVGFTLWWLLLLRSTGSRFMGFSSCGSRALERRLSSCSTWA